MCLDVDLYLKPEWLTSGHCNFVPPTPEELRVFIAVNRLTQIEYGALVGATPSGVGKWLLRSDSKNHRPIPYSAWRLGLFELGYLSNKKLKNT